jgi:hypothetical protein
VVSHSAVVDQFNKLRNIKNKIIISSKSWKS